MKQSRTHLEAVGSLVNLASESTAFALPAKKRSYPKNRKMPKEWRLGERNAARKIGWLEAAEIRMAPRGYGKTKALAVRFGLSKAQIRRIRAGRYWNFGGAA